MNVASKSTANGHVLGFSTWIWCSLRNTITTCPLPHFSAVSPCILAAEVVSSLIVRQLQLLMRSNIHDIEDLLTAGAPIHTINQYLAGARHTLGYQAPTCEYQCGSSQAGSSRSICAVTALNCVRLAFQLQAGGGDEENILGSFVSEDMVNQVMNIVNDLSFDAYLEIDDLLEMPIFKETIISRVEGQDHYPPEAFKDLFVQSFPPESLKPITAVVFSQILEHLVCFRFQSSGASIFVIFDPHSRSEHPFGPAFILANDVDIITTHFNQLLTQSSISQPTRDVINPCSFTALIIEPRKGCSTIDVKDLLSQSVAYLSEKLGTADHTRPTLDLGTPLPDHLERLRVRAESLRTQKPADAAHNRQTCHTRPTTPGRKKDVVPSTRSTRRSEFGWQLNLQVSSTPSIVDTKNDKDPDLAESPDPPEIKKIPTKNEFDWLASLILNPEPDGEDVDISLSSASKADKKSVPDATIPRRTEFGWQMALQQLRTDRRSGKDLEIMASAVVPQLNVQTHGVLLGKEKEASEEVSATYTLPKVTESAWQDTLKHFQEDDENFASSSTYLPRDSKPLPSEGESSTIRRGLRHSSMFTTYYDAGQIPDSNRRFSSLELPTNEFSAESHECGVCNELYRVAQVIQLPTCAHAFCRECLYTFTKTKISEGRYPIFCPVCAIERTRINQSHITQEILERLELSEQDLEKLNALQLVAHSVILHCPKCKQTMNVDRREYSIQRLIICPLPACRHKWCKECLKPLANSQTEHNCKQHGFDRLMRKKGWKYCPGCKTPVQKEVGCNHMTCGSPGCNVHFCYKCGVSIIDTSDGGDVGTAVTEHYINCVMFEKRRRCIIQ